MARLSCLALCLQFVLLTLAPADAYAEGRLREFLKNRQESSGASASGGERTRLRDRLGERNAESTDYSDSAQEDDGGLRDMLGGAGTASSTLSSASGKSCADWSKSAKKMGARAGDKLYGPKADIVDVPYGSHELQKLDVFLNHNSALTGPAPIIFMVHGGGWCVGDKAMRGVTTNKVARWTPKGFVFVSVNYPMVADGSDAIAQANDVARALAFVQANAARWGGDGERIILMGHSAGAHLVSLVNADAAIRSRHGVKRVLGTVSLDSGATNVVTQMPKTVRLLKERYLEAFGTTEQSWMAASPYHQLSASAAPWLGVCAARRPDDPCGQAEEYAAKSNSLGIRAEVQPEKKSHGAISNELGETEDYTRAVERFMASLDPVVRDRLAR